MLGAEQFVGFPTGGAVFALIVLWSIAWKGLALWKAARAGAKAWFVVILILNTLGILEIVYIFAVKPRTKISFQKKEETSTENN